MTPALGTSRLGRAASAGALGLMFLTTCACGSALAQAERPENDPSIWNLDSRLWNGFLSAMGMKFNTEVGIDYRERSPLVVPPQPDLPPPENVAPKSAAWPVDPDVKRRQDAIAAARKQRSARTLDPELDGRTLSPSELSPAGTGRVPASSGSPVPAASDDSLLPSQLGYFGGLFSLKRFGLTPDYEVGTFTGEPPREALTAPPVGYQTPSPAQPYGVTKRVEYDKPAKVQDWSGK